VRFSRRYKPSVTKPFTGDWTDDDHKKVMAAVSALDLAQHEKTMYSLVWKDICFRLE